MKRYFAELVNQDAWNLPCIVEIKGCNFQSVDFPNHLDQDLKEFCSNIILPKRDSWVGIVIDNCIELKIPTKFTQFTVDGVQTIICNTGIVKQIWVEEWDEEN